MARSVPFHRTVAEELRDPEFAREYTAELQRLRIAEQLARARQARGMTQGELARQMGTSQPAVARMERGDYGGYTIKALTKAAHALGQRLRVELVPSSRPASAIHAARKLMARKTAAKKK
jgi:transcriptional regulator with XRE-family HTH domain